MSALAFATAGAPLSAKSRSAVDGVRRVRALGLDAMELEFVYGVRMGAAQADEVRAAAEASKVTLTVHGPYYINLNGAAATARASTRRILDAAAVGGRCGAWSVTFHAGFFQGRDPERVHAAVRSRLAAIVREVSGRGFVVRISPEVTGKESQFGSLEALLRLAREVPGIRPCVDFSHLYARTGGRYNTYREFREVLAEVKRGVGASGFRQLHMHVSGIVYGPKGERHHTPLRRSDFNYRELLQALKDHQAGGTLVCESPAMERDALLLQKTYRDL